MQAEAGIVLRWKVAGRSKSFIIQFVLTFLVLMFIAFCIPGFFNYVQDRNGTQLNDPLLNLIQPVNLSVFTFTLIYASLVATVVYLFFFPEGLLKLMQAYCILTLIRVLVIWVVPLNEPSGIIVLQDPFVDRIGYGGRIITKDLFFSGHVSTMFLLYLVVKNEYLKRALLVSTILIGSMILIQHVHYTIDVLAAPFFSWLAVRTAELLFRKKAGFY